jgi:hypothetical protein
LKDEFGENISTGDYSKTKSCNTEIRSDNNGNTLMVLLQKKNISKIIVIKVTSGNCKVGFRGRGKH